MGAVPMPNGADSLASVSCKLRDYKSQQRYQHHGNTRAPRRWPSSSRTILIDASVLVIQLLLSINHLRRLLDASHCTSSSPPSSSSSFLSLSSTLPAHGPLSSYPCTARLPARLAFLALHAGSALRASFALPINEIWIALSSTVVVAQLVALLVLPHQFYLAYCRRPCMLLVGLLPKAVSLVVFLALPGAEPSSYFSTYLHVEGAIVGWQHVVYNVRGNREYPFWPGLAVLAAHCGLTTAICVAVGSRTPALIAADAAGPTYHTLGGSGSGGNLSLPVPSDGGPLNGNAPLFNAAWVLAHTGMCALLAAALTVLQNPDAVRRLNCYLLPRRLSSSGNTGATTTAAKAPAEDPATHAGCRAAGVCDRGGLREAHNAPASEGQYPGVCSTAEAQLAHVLRKLLGGGGASGRRQGGGAAAASASPGSVSAAGSALSSQPTSAGALEAPSAAGSGSRPEAPDLSKSSAAAPKSTAGAGPAAFSALPSTATRHTTAPPLATSGLGSRATAAAATAAVSAGPSSAPPPLPGRPLQYSAAAVMAARVPAAAMPPAGAFSLKQPTGLSKWTIVEDQEFPAPASSAAAAATSGQAAGMAVGMGVSGSLEAISLISGRSRRFRRYQSRAPVQRVHMKIPWAEPDQLPSNFLERLNVALSEGLDCMAVGVAARAGCIELVFDVVPHAAYDSASDRSSDFAFLPHQHHRHQQQRHQYFLPPSHFHHGHEAKEQQRQVAAAAAAPGAALIERLQPQHQSSLALSPTQTGLIVCPSGENAALGAAVDGLLLQMASNRDVNGAAGSAGRCLQRQVSAGGDPMEALEAAVLSGFVLGDAFGGEPASWIDALHLQPPPGAEVLTQACGRVWVSRWDHTTRQWVPEKAGGMRPSQLPRIAHLHPLCVLRQPRQLRRQRSPQQHPGQQQQALSFAAGLELGTSAAATHVAAGGRSLLRLTVSNADSMPSFSARCRGRYLPVIVHEVRWGSGGGEAGGEGPGQRQGHPQQHPEAADDSACQLGRVRVSRGPAEVVLELPAGLPGNGLVIVECKVGKLVSNWRPVLVTQDPRLAADLATLSPDPPASSSSAEGEDDARQHLHDQHHADTADVPSWDELLTDLGLWLDYLEVRGLYREEADTAGVSSSGSGSRDRASDRAPVSPLPSSPPSDADGSACDGWGSGPISLRSSTGTLASSSSSDGSGSGGGHAGDGGRVLARQEGSSDFGAGLAGLYGTEPYKAHMAGIAVSLLEFAVDRGWTHTAGMLVSQAAAAGIPWPELLRRTSPGVSPAGDGLSLAARAVRCGSPDMVALLAALGERYGAPLDWLAVVSGAGMFLHPPEHVPASSSISTAAAATPAASAACTSSQSPLPGPAATTTTTTTTTTTCASSSPPPDGARDNSPRLADRIMSEYRAACALWASSSSPCPSSSSPCPSSSSPCPSSSSSSLPIISGTPAEGTSPCPVAIAVVAAAAPREFVADSVPGYPELGQVGAGRRLATPLAGAAAAATAAAVSRVPAAAACGSDRAVKGGPKGAATDGGYGGGGCSQVARDDNAAACGSSNSNGSRTRTDPCTCCQSGCSGGHGCGCGCCAGRGRGGCGGGGGSGRRLHSAWGLLIAALVAPFANDPRVEARYVEEVGAASGLRTCCYLVYMTSIVAAVLGRMIKELRPHDMCCMLLFFSPYVVALLLLCVNYTAWLRSREAIWAAVTLTRTTAKLLPVLGLLPYSRPCHKYTPWAMDVFCEGLMPALFESMRAPLVLPLRVVEGLVTGLLYDKLDVMPSLPRALLYALAWNLLSAAITAVIDSWQRAHLQGAPSCAASAGSGAGGSGAVRAAEGESRPVVGRMEQKGGRQKQSAGWWAVGLRRRGR